MKNLKATIQIAEDAEFHQGIEQMAQALIEKYMKQEVVALQATAELQKFMALPENKKKIFEIIDAAIKAEVYKLLYHDGEIIAYIRSVIEQSRVKIADRLSDENLQQTIAGVVGNMVQEKLRR